jgi:NADH:ubiquinone oxidoreductase subunit E
VSAAELEPEEAAALAARVPRFSHGSRVPGWDQAADLWKDPAEIPDPASTEVPAELRVVIEGHMANYPDRRSAALPALAAAQRLHGWCSPQAVEQVACVMRVTPGYLDAVATFYDMLETAPVGRHSVYVCTNISCSLRGADELYAAFGDAVGDDPDFNVRAFECLGACDIAPMASVDGVYVGPLDTADIEELLDDVRAGRPVLPDKQLATRAVADPHANSRQWPAHPPRGSDGRAASTAHAGHADPHIDPDRAGFGPLMGEGEPGGPETQAPPARGDTAAPIEHAPPVEHAPHTAETDESSAAQGGDEDVRAAEATEDRAARRDPEREDASGDRPATDEDDSA